MFCRSLFILFLFAIVLSILLWLKASDYPFGILTIVLSVLLWLKASDYPFGILAIALSVLWLKASDYLFGILAIVLSVLLWLKASDHPFGILAIVLSVLLWWKASDYPFGIFKCFLSTHYHRYHCGRDRTVVGLSSVHAINVYRHYSLLVRFPVLMHIRCICMSPWFSLVTPIFHE